MRLFTLVLIFTVVCSAALAETGYSPFRNIIETDSNTKLQNRDLFRPNSGLTVELDGAFLQRRLSDSSQAAELADQIEDVYQLTVATNTSLAILKELSEKQSAAERTMKFGDISPLYKQVLKILKKRYPDDLDQLRKNIRASTASLEVDLNTIFESASTIADRSSIAINKLMPKVSVRLQLSRDPDLSRQPSQPFGVLPSANVSKANDIMNELGGTAAATSPQALADGIKNRFLDSMKKQQEEALKKAKNLIDKYEQNANAILKGLGDNSETIKKVSADLDVVKSSYDSLVTAINAVTEADPSLSLAERASRASLVPSLAQSLNALLIKQKKNFETLNIDNATKEATESRKAIVAFLNDVEKSAETFGKEEWQSAVNTLNANLELLNLRAKLQQIGETLQEAKDRNVQFDNNDGSLGSMPKMRSYDEIRISVVQMTDPAKPVQVGPPFYLIAWQPYRCDNITALGYYRKGDNKWAAAPILGQVYKFYSGRDYSKARICPGIGYSVMSLDTDDDGQVEVGVGLTLSLFDDHIIGGLGYNTAGKGDYLFAGYRVRIN